MNNPRTYNYNIPKFCDDVMTLAEWEECIRTGVINEHDGMGFWCKDGKESRDDVFDTEQEDATHVSWYNK